MLYLKNSKGNEARSLVDDIFQVDVINRASCLPFMLKVLRKTNPAFVQVHESGSIRFSLLTTAEGILTHVVSTDEQSTTSLLKNYHVLELLREATPAAPEAMLFDSLIDFNTQIPIAIENPSFNTVKLILILDPHWRADQRTKLLQLLHLLPEYELKERYFGFFTRITFHGRFGSFFGWLDQSFLQHLIPSRFKTGIYIELHHGRTT